MDYNHDIQEKIVETEMEFLEVSEPFAQMIHSLDSCNDGFGTEALAKDYLEYFDPELTKIQEAYEKLKNKVYEFYPDLKK